jgi:DNA/RNA endonuclease G (NUC1)
LYGGNVQKGHLSPNADFQFAPQRIASSIYLNAVPMDSNFNQNSWRALEDHVRRRIKTHGNGDATVWTGIIPQKNGASLDNVKKIISYPDIVWKIVKIGNDGIAFFENANKSKTKINLKCSNQCKALSASMAAEFSCCSVRDFVNDAGIKDNKHFHWPTEVTNINSFLTSFTTPNFYA